MKDPKSHIFESGTFVCMPYIKFSCNKIKNSLVHRQDFYNFVNMVWEWGEHRKIITNPGLWARRLFLALFSKNSFIASNGPEIIQNEWIWLISAKNLSARESQKSANFMCSPSIWVDFLYTEYTECKKVIGSKNAFFWKVPWGYFLMAKYQKFARFHPYMAIVRSIPDLALKICTWRGIECTNKE